MSVYCRWYEKELEDIAEHEAEQCESQEYVFKFLIDGWKEEEAFYVKSADDFSAYSLFFRFLEDNQINYNKLTCIKLLCRGVIYEKKD